MDFGIQFSIISNNISKLMISGYNNFEVSLIILTFVIR